MISVGWTAGRLAAAMPTLAPEITCAEGFDWFDERPNQVAAAVVDPEGRVQGIVNRLRFLSTYAKRYIPELYGKQSIMKMANPTPLIVDEGVTVADLGMTLALDWPDALRECFVVTRSGRYLGIGTCEALVRSKVELLTAREAELKTALLRATDANQTKSNFLALMSHELRTPLNAIIGFSELVMSQTFGPVGNERYLDYVGDIHGAGKHLLVLINDILDISKAEAGKLDLHPEWVDVSALIDECLRLVAGRAHDQGVRLSSQAAHDLPRFYADSLRVKQILLNLLSNAVKFTPPKGSVKATAEIGSDGGFVFAVSDTGIGMPPEAIPLALEPFRQIASPMSRTVEGTGLGLSLTKVLTEQHGGELTIDSALNEGTTVWLHFPLSRTEIATDQDSGLSVTISRAAANRPDRRLRA